VKWIIAIYRGKSGLQRAESWVTPRQEIDGKCNRK
jgi:hypothetical protein